MLDELKKLQQEIYNYSVENKGQFYTNYSPKLSFFPVGDLFEINFFGDGYDDDPDTKISEIDYQTNFAFCSLLDFLSDQNRADKVISIDFTGPDEGANGTKSWNFNRLLNSNVIFPKLKNFKIQLTDLGDHNQSIIDDGDLEENGMVAKLVSRMPNLEQLVIPSAPDYSFFEIGEHPLKILKLQAGYNHQNFITNLAKSNNFKQLTILDYTDLIDFYDLLDEEYTSFDNFIELFNSQAFSSVKNFKLRNTNLKDEQLFELQKLNKVPFLIIKAGGGRYVSHLMNQ
ncbi:hypothetical protein [Flavobacterium notoginsengisoli]|uniref:hypothetical protein n=1 Tax=Flavobacterium notoginsengisoli TaxID=1478199 RepID=UPI00362D0137